MTRLLAIGGLTIDWLQTPDGRFGPTLGGNAAYAAIGGWLAGGAAEVVAVVGDDYPPELLRSLEMAGIGISSVRLSPGPSFRVLLDESGPGRSIRYLPGSGRNDRLDPVPSQLPDLRAGDAAHICAISTDSQRAMIDALGGVPTVTLDSVVIAGEIEPDRDELISLARRVSAFLPSQDEVAHHWPGPIEQALGEIARAGIDRVVVKVGSAGAIGRDRGQTIHVPVVPAVVLDPTGAGDAFCGAACVRLADHADFGDAMVWGAAAASVVIEGHGAAHALSTTARQMTASRAAQLRPRLMISDTAADTARRR